MRQGGIFNGLSAIGAVQDELEEYSEAPGTALTVPQTITDLDTPETIAAIIAADRAKLAAEKKAAASSSALGTKWAGLTDLQKLALAVGGVLVVGLLYKAMKPSRSYASNPYGFKSKRRSAQWYRDRVYTQIDAKNWSGAYAIAESSPSQKQRDRLYRLIEAHRRGL